MPRCTRSTGDAKADVTYYTDNSGDGYDKRDASGQWAYGTGYQQVGTVHRPLPKARTEPASSGAAPAAEPTTTDVLSRIFGDCDVPVLPSPDQIRACALVWDGVATHVQGTAHQSNATVPGHHDWQGATQRTSVPGGVRRIPASSRSPASPSR